VQTQTPKLTVRKRAGEDPVSLDAGGGAITCTLNEFCRITGVSKMTAWRLDVAGEIDTITIGKRRLVILASYHALIARRQAAKTSRLTLPQQLPQTEQDQPRRRGRPPGNRPKVEPGGQS
jgi:hypothetical protein